MTTATVTAIPASDMTVRVSITVAGAVAGERLSVWREDDGTRTPVLGGTDVAALSTVIIDPASPLNRPVTWGVTLASGVEVRSAPATLASSLPVLSDPWRGLAALVMVTDVDDERVTKSRATVLTVEGDPTPIVVWDVPTREYGELEVLSLDAVARRRIVDMCATGRMLLLRCSCGQHEDWWLQATGDVKVLRLTRKGSVPARLHRWDAVVYLGRPADMSQRARGDTLGDLHAMVPTKLGDIAASWSTLGEIASTSLTAGL